MKTLIITMSLILLATPVFAQQADGYLRPQYDQFGRVIGMEYVKYDTRAIGEQDGILRGCPVYNVILAGPWKGTVTVYLENKVVNRFECRSYPCRVTTYDLCERISDYTFRDDAGNVARLELPE